MLYDAAQRAQEISHGETEKREYDKLLSIRDNYPKYVLRTDEFPAATMGVYEVCAPQTSC